MTLWSGHVTVRTPQDLEDLATAGWLSETLFASLELGLFEALAELAARGDVGAGGLVELDRDGRKSDR